MKTIDEVIKEYEEDAKGYIGLSKETSFDDTHDRYIRLAQEKQQIANWLKELKEFKERLS